MVGLTKLVDKIHQTAEDTELIENQTLRFGNPAFRVFLTSIGKNWNEWLEEFIGSDYKDSFIELSTYLSDSFGNDIRIDYGTGHELHFIAFLCCLFDLTAIGTEDLESICFQVILILTLSNDYILFYYAIQ